MSSIYSERDWTEDFEHENGQYMCRCHECENTFIGYKRRVTCKVCANKHPEQAEGAQGEREVLRGLAGCLQDAAENGDLDGWGITRNDWVQAAHRLAALAQPSQAQVYACPECGTGMQVDPSAKPRKAQPSPAPELEQQEPSEYRCQHEDGRIVYLPYKPNGLWDCQPLYRHPVAQAGQVPEALREAVEYLDNNPYNEIGSGSILHRQMRDAIAAAPQPAKGDKS